MNKTSYKTNSMIMKRILRLRQAMISQANSLLDDPFDNNLPARQSTLQIPVESFSEERNIWNKPSNWDDWSDWLDWDKVI